MHPDLKPLGASERRAEQLFFSGNFSEARIAYGQILEREPGRLDIRARMGRIALIENNPEQAIFHLTGALNNGLRTQSLWDALANAYLANREPGSAALCYERAGRIGLAGTLAVMADRELCRIEAGAGSLRYQWLSETPLPVIHADINGVSLNLLIDTAAGDLILDEQAAVAAGVPQGGRETRYFSGGLPSIVTYGHVQRLQLGTLVVHDLLTQLLDLQGKFAAYASLVPIHGILGLSVLSRFGTILDFKQRVLYLNQSDQEPDNPSEVPVHRNPFWIAENSFIIVRAAIPNIESAMWIIDTGLAGTAFVIGSTAAEDAGCLPLGGKPVTGIGGGGIVTGRPVLLPALKLGDLDLDDISGMSLQSFPLEDRFGFRVAGLLSCEYFQDSVLALDFSNLTLTVS